MINQSWVVVGFTTAQTHSHTTAATPNHFLHTFTFLRAPPKLQQVLLLPLRHELVRPKPRERQQARPLQQQSERRRV